MIPAPADRGRSISTVVVNRMVASAQEIGVKRGCCADLLDRYAREEADEMGMDEDFAGEDAWE